MEAAQIGALGRAMAVLVGSLHQAGVIDGNAIAGTLRLDATGNAEADAFTDEIAELIRRTIELSEDNGPVRPRAID